MFFKTIFRASYTAWGLNAFPSIFICVYVYFLGIPCVTMIKMVKLSKFSPSVLWKLMSQKPIWLFSFSPLFCFHDWFSFHIIFSEIISFEDTFRISFCWHHHWCVCENSDRAWRAASCLLYPERAHCTSVKSRRRCAQGPSHCWESACARPAT